MNGIYRYSIVRFRPYAETGEFANIGIVVFDLREEVAEFRLSNKRFARISHFFDPSANSAYMNAIENLRVELPRLLNFLPETHSRTAFDHFSELFGSRESSILFSEPRVIKSGFALETVADNLFDRFVRRDFEKPLDPEAALTKSIRKNLHRHGVKHFKTLTVSDDIIPVRFPLGFHETKVVAIKPLAFAQKNPIHIVDYGAHWRKRLAYHLNKGTISEESVFLALERPSFGEDEQSEKAFQLALQELERLPFKHTVLDAHAKGIDIGLLDFVERHPPRQQGLVNYN